MNLTEVAQRSVGQTDISRDVTTGEEDTLALVVEVVGVDGKVVVDKNGNKLAELIAAKRKAGLRQ